MSHVINPKTTVGRRDPMQEFPSFVDPFWKIFYFRNKKNGGAMISSSFQTLSPLSNFQSSKIVLMEFWSILLVTHSCCLYCAILHKKDLSSNIDEGNEIDSVHESSSTWNTNIILTSCDTTNQCKNRLARWMQVDFENSKYQGLYSILETFSMCILGNCKQKTSQCLHGLRLYN